MSVYIVDYENVSKGGLVDIEKLLTEDVVIIFWSTNQPNIPIEIAQKIQWAKAKVVFKQANVIIKDKNKPFHDALDMQLATYVGYLVGKHQDRETTYYVVSNDQGFGFICEFWRNRGFKVYPISNLSEGNVKDEIRKINENVAALIGDCARSESISKIIRDHRTKTGVRNCLISKYEDGEKIYDEILPLLKDKKA